MFLVRMTSPIATGLRLAALATLGAVSVAAAPAAATGDTPLTRHALLIGVAEYANESMAPLPYAGADAVRLAEVLTGRGDYESATVTTIGGGADATTSAKVRSAIDGFLAGLGPHDSAMVYFSGHGDLADNGTLLLAPSDFDPADAANSGVAAAWLRERLAGCAAGAKLLVLDACHAGASDRGVSGNAVVEGFDEAEGVVTLASSAAAESSVMDGRLQGSLFSFWLTNALRGHADRDVDGAVTVSEAFAYVDRHVTAEALGRYGEPQSPRMSRNMAVSGDPTMTALRTQPLQTVLDDMADQIAWHAANERLGRVGCLSEFTTLSWFEGRLASVLGVESGMAGKTLATRFQGKVKEKLVDRRGAMQLVTPAEADSLIRSGGDDFAALVGEIRMQQGDSVLLQASIRKGGVDLYTVAGRAAVTLDDWAEHGHSVVVRPSDFRTARDPSTGLMKSAESVAVATLDDRVKSDDYQHPMATDDLGCSVRLFVPSGRNRYFIRTPVYRDGKAYVGLDKGETYQIELDYDLERLNEGRPVYAKILVDGVSIRAPQLAIDPGADWMAGGPQAANPSGAERTDAIDGGFRISKGVDLVRIARNQSIGSLGLGQMWLLDGATKPLRYKGFYLGAGQDALAFTVVDSADSIGADRDYGQAVGLISIVLYDVLGAGRGGDVGTAAGLPVQGARLREVKAPGGVGRQIAVLHLNYCSSQALRQLER
ncbi:MAG: caspase family protein [Planctomycetota bacterium]